MKSLVILRFSVTACLIKNVDVCATQIPNGMEASHMGIMLTISFISSTLFSVASVHGLRCFSAKSSRMAAFSRNLKHFVIRFLISYLNFTSGG